MTESSRTLEGLNQEQREAVSAPLSNMLVLAGAGSGKTRVLTCRFAHLVDGYGVSPSSIMALTFTRKAADEMRERIEALLGHPLRGLWIGTFHALALRILRYHSDKAGLPSAFEVLAAGDQQRIVRRILRGRELNDREFPPARVCAFINSRKEAMQRPKDLGSCEQPWEEQAKAVYKAYEELCQSSGLVDFAEILLRTYELLSTDEELLEEYRFRFQHLLVDEFQDTNDLQYRLIRLLAGDTGKVLAVGDDDQSIYGWRGAQIGNLEKFRRDFPEVSLIKLEQNYRSTQAILEAANAVINHNQGRIGKHLWTDKGQGESIKLHEAANARDEADFVLNQIHSWQADGRSLSEVAVLYRSHAQSRILEERCRLNSTAYSVRGGTPFYEREEIRHALAYMRLLEDPNVGGAFDRVINFPPRGIGDRTQALIRSHALSHECSLWESCCRSDFLQELPPRARQAVQHFCEQVSGWRQEVNGLTLSEIAFLAITSTGLKDYYRKETPSEISEVRIENLEELIVACHNYEETEDEGSPDETPDGTTRLQRFLDRIMLDAPVEGENAPDTLSLMTLHSAKGLEFPLVFMVGMEQNIFPHRRALEDRGHSDGLEEERRLCYVGITRAMELLYLTYAQSRQMYSRTEYNMPSQFLFELSEEEQEEPSASASSKDEQEPPPSLSDVKLRKGSRVSHRKFGAGVVISVSGSGEHTQASVAFHRSGVKNLMIRYAPLTLLD